MSQNWLHIDNSSVARDIRLCKLRNADMWSLAATVERSDLHNSQIWKKPVIKKRNSDERFDDSGERHYFNDTGPFCFIAWALQILDKNYMTSEILLSFGAEDYFIWNRNTYIGMNHRILFWQTAVKAELKSWGQRKSIFFWLRQSCCSWQTCPQLWPEASWGPQDMGNKNKIRKILIRERKFTQ